MARIAPIILFCYPGSVFSRRAAWYLDLRNIHYKTCVQSSYPPRPIIHEGLKISYRRIPLLAIGLDIYCDTRLIIRKLEELFPPATDNAIEGPTTRASRGTMNLLENITIVGGVFSSAVGLLSPKHLMLKDPKWVQDREELSDGFRMTPDVMAVLRPGSLSNIRNVLHMIDGTFLADGRTWIDGGQKPSLSDLHIVWVFDWIFHDPFMKDSITTKEREDLEHELPRAFRWMRNWRNVISKAAASDLEWTSTEKSLEGHDAVAIIVNAGYVEGEGDVDTTDPTGLSRNQVVEVWPTDYGSKAREKGRLVRLTVEEIVLEKQEPEVNGIRLHFPRTGYAIQSSF
ncbi:hypothetical protein K490DRAFT_71103 [Saccharata proteae CBS 121410]|uniref:GST N-terminal domain-containing protein n=1 Tax=Saccharata proteae CBS 121410 TaxID=1314787 RepID=A0A9P4LYX8_9PEZI|nr:hypothetical protein K490DRAFT_71103 [Saccharata proteae CBS 121410]